MAQARTNNSDLPAVASIPADELKDIIEAGVADGTPPPAPIDLGGGTILETNTVYEDRTINPVVDPVIEYRVHREDLGNGTIMETYGTLIGSEDEDDKAAE